MKLFATMAVSHHGVGSIEKNGFVGLSVQHDYVKSCQNGLDPTI